MGDLWGFESVPMLPRKKQFYEFLPQITEALGRGAEGVMNSIASDKRATAERMMQQQRLNMEQQRVNDQGFYQRSQVARQAEAEDRMARTAAAKSLMEQNDRSASPITSAMNQFGPDLREPEVVDEAQRWNSAMGSARQGKPILETRYPLDVGELPQNSLKPPDMHGSFNSLLYPPLTQSPGDLSMDPSLRISVPKTEEVPPQQFVQERANPMANAIMMARMRQASEKLQAAKAHQVSPQDYVGRETLKQTLGAERDAARVGANQALLLGIINGFDPKLADGIRKGLETFKDESRGVAANAAADFTRYTGRQAPTLTVNKNPVVPNSFYNGAPPTNAGQSPRPPSGMNHQQIKEWGIRNGLSNDQIRALLTSPL
jgi:hypothetical protein